MLGLKYFALSLLLLLSLNTSQYSNDMISVLDHQTELTASANDTHHQAVVVDAFLESNEGNSSFKTFKLPYIGCHQKAPQRLAATYNHKLLYLKIGDGLPLQLTSRTLIFPFHFFT